MGAEWIGDSAACSTASGVSSRAVKVINVSLFTFVVLGCADVGFFHTFRNRLRSGGYGNRPYVRGRCCLNIWQ